MYTNKKWYFILLIFLSPNADGQSRLKFINFETGIDFISCGEVEKDYIRAAMSQSYGNTGLLGNDGPLYRDVRNEMHKTYLAIKVEVRTKDNYVGFISGLRLTQVVGSIERSGAPDFFYLRLRQTETSTEYLKVEKLQQFSNYLSMPLEVRAFAYRQRPFRLYFSGGGEVGYRLSTVNVTTFDNPSMNGYQNAVSEIVGKPDKWYTTIYGRAGFMLGRETPRLSFGVTAPVIITGRNSTLNKPTVGIGLHVQAQMPF
jgi:hypothetical protein